MGVYIKGMEMPKNCGECKFFAWKRVVGNHCAVDENITFHAILDGIDVCYEKNGNCPLVPIPPHGRCIDVDALIKELTLDDEDDKTGATLLMAIFLEVLKAAPTIIPAEEEKRNNGK